MPKFEKIVSKIAGKEYEIEIWYTQKYGFFMKGYPKALNEFAYLDGSGYYNKKYESPKEIIEKLDAVIEEYESKIRTERKVILMTIHIMGDVFGEMITKKTGFDDDETWKEFNKEWDDWKNNFGFTDNMPGDYGFGFSYNVALEYASGNEKVYHTWDEDDDGKGKFSEYGHPLDNSKRVMEWTPEREEFFKNLKATTIELNKRIIDFFATDNIEILIETTPIKLLK